MHEEDEWSTLRSAMTILHEMFQTLQVAGFTEDQSLKLLALIMSQTGDAFLGD